MREKEIPQTYEEVKAFLETRHIHIEDHPKQLMDPFRNFPFFRATNWEDLKEAIGHCSSPVIKSTMCSSSGPPGAKVMVLDYVEIYDDFIWNNENYRVDLLDEMSIESDTKRTQP